MSETLCFVEHYSEPAREVAPIDPAAIEELMSIGSFLSERCWSAAASIKIFREPMIREQSVHRSFREIVLASTHDYLPDDADYFARFRVISNLKAALKERQNRPALPLHRFHTDFNPVFDDNNEVIHLEPSPFARRAAVINGEGTVSLSGMVKALKAQKFLPLPKSQGEDIEYQMEKYPYALVGAGGQILCAPVNLDDLQGSYTRRVLRPGYWNDIPALNIHSSAPLLTRGRIDITIDRL